jgi:hypothetical protein
MRYKNFLIKADGLATHDALAKSRFSDGVVKR